MVIQAFGEFAQGDVMNWFVASMVLTVVSYVAFHIAMKSAPGDMNPMVMLLTIYFTAIGAALLNLILLPQRIPVVASFKKIDWTVIAAGVAVFGIELGFLYAYRVGWKVNVAAVVSNVAATLLLVPLGYFIFKDELNITKVLGLLLCLGGLALVNLK